LDLCPRDHCCDVHHNATEELDQGVVRVEEMQSAVVQVASEVRRALQLSHG